MRGHSGLKNPRKRTSLRMNKFILPAPARSSVFFFALCLFVTGDISAQDQVGESSETIQATLARLSSCFLQGYQKNISGETIGYHSANEYVKEASLVRALDGRGEITWVTAVVPASVTDSTVTFAWMAGLAGSKGVHRFDMFIDHRLALSFSSAADSSKKILDVQGREGERLTFVVTRVDQFSDLFGYMFLQIPTRLVTRGKELTITVAGANEGSIAWYMTFQHQLEQIIHVEALPLLVARGDSSFQLIKVGIEHYGPVQSLKVYVDSNDRLNKSVHWGLTTCMLSVSAVAKTVRKVIVLESEGKVFFKDTVTLNPIHRRVFYLLPHAHTDIGYSDYQTVVEQDHVRYIDDGIRLAQKTAAYPVGSQFKWNIEVLWPLESYVRQATGFQTQRLIEAIRKGWIGINALYANLLTGLCKPEELIHATEYARALGREYSLTVHTAMMSDVPAYTSSTVTALGIAGIKYLSSGPNYLPTTADEGDRIGYALKTWGDKPFYWESESGQYKVLFWMAGRGYSWFHGLNMGRLRDASLSTICEYLDELDRKNYPYDMVQVRYTMGDNAPPDSDLSDCVEAWNETYVSPKMVIATSEEMFETFEKKYGDRLPLYKGDFTPYWEDGAASTARELALNRNAAEKLVQAAALDAMTDPALYDSSAYYSAWRNVLLFDEHTWGSANSISEPDSPDVKAQWEYKKQIVHEGVKDADALLEKGMRSLTGSGSTRTFDVINTSSWTRTDLVLVPQEFSKSIKLVTNSKGVELPSQRLTSGDLAVLVKDVPAFGVERLYLKLRGLTRASPDLWVGHDKIDNGTISLTVDETTGAIKSLLWNNEEFVDTTRGSGLNQYLYVPGRDPGTALTDLLTDVSVKERGPLVASLLIESSPSGTNGFRREIRLVKGLDRVDIIDTIDKKKVREKESVHLGFPFLVPHGTIRMDNGWEFIRPEIDQLSGSCKDYFSIQRWVDVSNESRGVTWTNPDAPLVEIGQMTNEAPDNEGRRVWRQSVAPAQNIYSYVMNNYWHTNYKADQEGIVSFRYSIVPHNQYDDGRAEEIGIEASQPLLVVPANDRRRARGSLLSVEPASVVVSSLKPSNDRKGFIVRLFNAGDDSTGAVIRWHAGKVRIYRSDVAEERGNQIHWPLLLPRYGVATLRIERAR